MKTLKLNTLASENLSKVEMNQVNGGVKCCGCGCQGPSSTSDNGNANNKNSLYSPGGVTEWVCTPDVAIANNAGNLYSVVCP